MNKHLLIGFLIFCGFASYSQTITPTNSFDPNAPTIQKRDLITNANGVSRGASVTCGTGAGETPFTIQIVSDSSYNGFDLVCSDSCSGYFTATVVGGVGPFQFLWFGTTNSGVNNQQRLTEVCNQSQIQVVVTDIGQSVSCGATHTLNVPTEVTTINFSLTQPSCPATCDGTATHFPIFGVAPYDFQWSNGNTNQNANDLCLGLNTLVITDQNGCTFDTTINILNPPNMMANIDIQDVTCDGFGNGQATSTPSGGNGGPYTFQWEELPASTVLQNGNGVSDNVGSLSENISYQLFIEDVDGCPYDTTFTMTDILPMTLTEDANIDASCANTCDGQIDITINGGSGNYVVVEWYEGTIAAPGPLHASGPSFSQSDLCPNTDYFVTVEDDEGCTNDFQLTPVSSPPPFVFDTTVVDVTCGGQQDGSINVTLTGGTPIPGTGYLYNWTSLTGGTGLNPTDEDQTGLSGGIYRVVWTDQAGCQDSADIEIEEPNTITTSGIVTDVSCFDLTDGSIDITTAGGNGGYVWTWTQSANGNIVDFTTEDQNNLDSGSYSLNIVDALGCTYDTTIIVSKPGEIFFNAIVTQMQCAGDNDAIIDLTNTSNGVPNYNYSWTSVPVVPIGDNTGDINTNLQGADYTITVTDQNGCDKDTTITIDEPDVLDLTDTFTDVVCNGDDDGTITITVVTGEAPVTVTWAGPTAIVGNNNFAPTNLSPGNYTATVQDVNGCQEVLNFTISEPDALQANLSSTDLTCNGVADGTATVVPSGGPVGTNYLIDWDNDPRNDFDDATTLNPILAGTYCVNIQDDNGCTLAIDSCVIVSEPDSIRFGGSTINDVSCFGALDGSINLNVFGGTEANNYDFAWAPVEACYTGATNIQNISSLCGGSYTVTATDDNGCTNDTTFVIDEPAEIILTSSFVDPGCTGQTTGSITINIVSADPVATVTWVASNGGTAIPGNSNFTPTGLSAGDYTATVLDGNGCDEVLNFTLTDQTPLQLTITGTDLTCNGLQTGTVSIVPSGGNVALDYSYDWDNDPRGDFDDTQNLTALAAGTYCVNIQDDNGCTLAADSCFTIIEPDSIFFTGSFHTDIQCNGDDNGLIDLTTTGGTIAADYSFNWNPVPGCYTGATNVDDINGLCPGTYTVTATDDNGCTNDTTFTIIEPIALSITTAHTDASCGVNDGTVTVTPTGGTVAGNYNIVWNAVIGTTPPGNSTFEQNLAPDTYNVTVTDDNGCSVQGSETITTATAPTITVDNITNLLCNGDGLGAIETTITGGVAPYTIAWGAAGDPGFTANSDDIFGLNADQYTIQVTDNNLCVAVQVIDVTEPVGLSVTLDNLSDVLCNGGFTGAIDITGNGGTIAADYTYSWTGPGSYSNNVDDIAGLPVGTYCINITDDNGCTMAADSCYVIDEPTSLTVDNITATDAQCNVPNGTATVTVSGGTVATDYTYLWVNNSGGANPLVDNASTATGMLNDAYTVTITDDNGCTIDASIAVQPTNGPAITLDATNDVTCNGQMNGAIFTTAGGGSGALTYSWSSIPAGYTAGNVDDITGLEGGTYVVDVTDGALCTTNLVITIDEPDAIVINDNITDATCNGEDGLVDISVSGGTVAGSYGYNWDNNGGTTFTDPEDLTAGAGTYNVVVSDDNGCTQNGGPYTINEPTAIDVPTSNTSSACNLNTGTVTVTPSGGTQGTAPNEYTYIWTDATGTQVGNAATANSLPAGCYDVTVTDVLGCTATTTECISDLNGPTITIDNQINPTCNGDNNGSIDLTITAIPGVQSIAWTATNGSAILPTNSSEDINSLTADEYNITATDNNGCVTSQSIELTENPAMNVEASITDPNCSNGNDGAITIDQINDAVLPIASTNWTGPNGYTNNIQDITGLEAGTYCLTIIDNIGCQLDTCFTLNAPTGLTLTTTATDTDCNAPTGTLNASANGGTPGYTFDWVGTGITTHPSGALVTGLDVGVYTLTVTDNNGCTSSTTENINTANGPTITIDNTNDVDCFGNSTGDIFVSVTDGTPTYTYDWDNLAGTNDPEDQTGLPAGTYTLVVTDLAGCDATEAVTINEPNAALSITEVVSDLECNSGADGEIDITVTGGTPDYTYTWTQNGNPIANNTNATGIDNVNGLDALTYDLLVTDINGCTETDSYTLIEPTGITANESSTDSDCGLSNGSVSVAPTGGTDGVTYNYDWIDFNTGLATPTPTQATVNGLGQGTYQCTITDLNGCVQTALVSISEVGGPTVTGTSTPVQCFGDQNGTIDLTVTGPPTFTFNWTGPTTIGNVEDPTGLEAGNYAVAVTDGSGCITNDNFVIDGPISPIAVNDITTDLNCFEDLSGEIDITISGGTSPYTVTWSGPNGYTNNVQDITGLEAGTYTLDITDDAGCTLLGTTITVDQPDEIVVVDNITGPSCGVADGAVSVTVTGGTLVNPDYTYVWTDVTNGILLPDTDNDITNIFAGNYQVDITDDNGCTQSTTLSVSNVNAPPLSFVTTDISCFGFDDGTIDLTVTGANTYTYDWDNLAGTNDPEDQLAGNLAPGTYAVSVLESPTGCISTGNVTLTEPDELTASGITTDLACNGDASGAIDLTILGGTDPINISWTGPTAIPNGTEDPAGLDAGTYQVTLTDLNNCTFIDDFTLTEPGAIDVTAVLIQNNCNGDMLGAIDVTVTNGVGAIQYAWDIPSSNEDQSNLAAGFYTLTVTDDNLCSVDSTFTITEPLPIIFDATVTDANCNLNDGQITTNVSGGTLTSPDYTYDWQSGGVSVGAGADLLLQTAGTYVFFVTDDNACTFDTTIVINNINAPVLTVDNIQNVTCFGDSDGAINISTTGGTAPYQYVWNPNGISFNEDLSGQPAGTYDIQVTDNAGCVNTLTGLVIGTPDEISGTLVITDATCGDCNGEATISGVGGNGGFNYLWSTNEINPTETDMCAGVYSVQITDALGCIGSEPVVINNTGGPTGETIVTTDPDCNGAANGSATVTAIGGTAPISYYWPHDGTSGPTHSALSGGTYFVEMTDDNGCVRIAQVDLNEPAAITFNSTIDPSTCNNADGSITLSNIAGGSAPITISWDNPGGLNTPGNPNISAGIYTATLTDNNGCTVSQSFTISDIDAPTIDLTTTDVLCNADANGVVTSVVNGAVGTISYQWYDGVPAIIAGETNPDLNNVSAGDYTLEITDAGTGCITLEQATINEPDALSITTPITQDASCDIACDGEATLAVSGGTPQYTYSWPSGATGATATDLCVGLNTVSVTDNNGCVLQTTINIDFDNQLSSVINEVDATCGECDGTATVAASGGSGNYTINWYDATTGNTHNNLCAGIYDFTIVDNANGCSMDMQTTINNIGGPDNETITITDVTCAGGNDGAATVVPSGGTAPYSFLWVPGGQTSATISNQSAGTYNLEVTDANNCTRVVPVTINEPTALELNYLAIDANCGQNDGSINLIPQNVIPNISYQWNGPGLVNTTNQSENNLAAGIYDIQATDGNGCNTNIQVPISTTTPPAFTVSGTDITCFGLNDGTATAVGAGLNFDWSNGDNTAAINSLAPGSYVVNATDPATGCIATASVLISEPDTLMMGVQHTDDPLCFGDCNGEISAIVAGGTIPYNYTWSSSGNTTATETGLCDGITTIQVTDQNGCVTSQDVTLTEPTQLTVTIDNVTDATCINSQDGSIDITATGGTPGYTYNWTSPSSSFTSNNEDITGLDPMNYDVTVTDANGCPAFETAAVDTIFVVIADAGQDSAICIGQCLVLNGIGTGPTGIVYEWNEVPSTTALSNADTVEICSNSDGQFLYTLTVSDANCTDTDTMILTVNPLPIVDAGPDIDEVIGSIQVIGGNPTGPSGSTYLWNPVLDFINLDDSTVSNPTLEIENEQDYVVFVTDTNGCVNSDTVNVRPIPEINFPNGITPNGDGLNDDWQIDYITQFPDCVVEVYNRWGELLFRNVGYTTRWDGTFNGKELPVGTYYYVIELNDPLFPEPYSGPITIMR